MQSTEVECERLVKRAQNFKKKKLIKKKTGLAFKTTINWGLFVIKLCKFDTASYFNFKCWKLISFFYWFPQLLLLSFVIQVTKTWYSSICSLGLFQSKHMQ